MPKAYLFLAELPAQIDDSTVTNMRKIAQPKIDIFDDDPQFMDRKEIGADVLETLHVMGPDRGTAPQAGLSRCFPHFLARLK